MTDTDIRDLSAVPTKSGSIGATLGRVAFSPGLSRHYRNSLVIGALICGDLVAALVAISGSGMAIRAIGLPDVVPHLRTAVLFVVIAAAVGLYRRTAFGPFERFRRRMIAMAAFIPFALALDFPTDHLAELLLVHAWQGFALLALGHYVEGLTRAMLSRAGLWGASTVLIGGASACHKLAHLLASRPELGLTPIGLIATGERPPRKLPHLPVIGTTQNFRAISPNLHIEVAIFANARDLSRVPTDCPAFSSSCRFLLAEDVWNVQSLWLSTRTLGSLVGIEIRRDLCRRRNRQLKRAFDLIIALPLAALLLPVIALLALAIKVVDPGPAFYIQSRVGRGGQELRVLKLRTMYPDAERRLETHLQEDSNARAEWHQFYKLRNDPRILPYIGNFIRRFSFDELPQIWNVIRGDMSLVGPRPLPSYHADRFDAGFKEMRSSLTPGITGLWQISTRSDGDLRAWKEHDSFYFRNWSLWLDLYIILETLPAVLSARGAR